MGDPDPGKRPSNFDWNRRTEAEAPSNSNCMRKLNEESKTQSTKKENSPGPARDDERSPGRCERGCHMYMYKYLDVCHCMRILDGGRAVSDSSEDKTSTLGSKFVVRR